MYKSIKFLTLFLSVSAFLFGCSPNEEKQKAKAMEQANEAGLYALIQTSKGAELFKLFETESQMAVEMFTGLATGQIETPYTKDGKGFYDGLEFYLVSEDRMVKSGSPLNRDSGDAGFTTPVQQNNIRHDKAGLLTLNLNKAKEAGSRIAITQKPLSYLDGRSIVIGEALTSLKSIAKLRSNDIIKSIHIFRITATGSTPADYIQSIDFKKKVEEFRQLKMNEKAAELENAAANATKEAQAFLANKGITNGLYAVMNTSKGNILLKLEFKKTPMTVANFVGLAEGTIENSIKPLGTPYYNGLKFHRVIPDFMIQGGCPLGTGSGDPGYKFPDEFDPTLRHDRPGILSMANSGPTTNGSQFFITHKDTSWLNDKHTVFGSVVDGMDVVNAIVQNDIIIKLDILRLGNEAKAFNPTDKSFRQMISNNR